MRTIAPLLEGAGLREVETILWDTRHTVIAQLVHYRLRAANVWTVLPAPPASQQAERIALRAAMRHPHLQL